MSAYVKALGLHVYLATTKKSYIENGIYLKVNAQVMIVLKQTLSNTHLSMISNYDFIFLVWNTLISLKGQDSNNLESEFSEDNLIKLAS